MKHNCECEHENIKYCKKCDKAYCVDCGKEWESIVYYTYPQYTTCIPDYTNTFNGGSTVKPVTCKHRG